MVDEFYLKNFDEAHPKTAIASVRNLPNSAYKLTPLLSSNLVAHTILWAWKKLKLTIIVKLSQLG